MEENGFQDRLLLLAPTKRDADAAAEIFRDAGIPLVTGMNIGEICNEIRKGAGAVVITEEAIELPWRKCLAEVLSSQPAWSELPLIVIVPGGTESSAARFAMQLPADVTLLERPVRVATLLSAVRSALKSRRRQHLLRDQMAELQASEKILLETEVRMQLASEAARIGFWQWQYDSRLLVTDQRFRELFGFSRESAPPAAEFLERLPPEGRKQLLADIEAQLAEGNRFIIETRIVLPGDVTRWIYAAGSSSERRSDGTSETINGMCMDITERKEVEERLRRQANLLDLTNDAIIVRSSDCRVLYWNRGAEEMYGWKFEEVRGLVTHELFQAVYPRPLIGLLRELRETGRWEGEAVHRTKSGEKVTVLARWALHFEEGQARVLEINTDISDRKQSEQRVEQTRRRLQTIIDTAPVPISYVDADLRFVFANSLYTRLRFRPGASFEGIPAKELLPDGDYEKVGPWLKQAAAGQPVTFEAELEEPRTGTKRFYIVAYAPDIDREGKVRGVVMALSDFTSMKEAQENLAAAKEAAEAASRAKSQFLANMSHEMRTPLAGVLGMVDLVLDMDLGEEQRSLLLTARRSADSLLRLIADILDYSSIEAGKLSFQPRDFRVRDLVTSVIGFFSVEAAKRGLKLWSEVAEVVPETMTADEGRLRQVLINLVGNAVKFTPEGEIAVTVEVPDGQTGMIRFAVRDTGIGISEAQMPRLFQLFSQLDPSSTRRFGGTGLGLALSREIVQQMGGEISVTSRVGEGSTFTVTLPLAPQ